jgi:hypothetical protein
VQKGETCALVGGVTADAGAATGSATAGAATPVAAGNLLPQPVQNAEEPSTAAPHDGQTGPLAAVGAGCTLAIGWPHDVQKFEDSLTSLPHDEQTAITGSCCTSFQDHPRAKIYFPPAIFSTNCE